jgi:serine/threonine protein kinase
MPPCVIAPNGKRYFPNGTLGTGAYGTVVLCRDAPMKESTNFVMKRTKLARLGAKERFASTQELALNLQLHHRNLVECVDAWVENRHTACLVLEHCGGQDMQAVTHSKSSAGMSEEDLVAILYQVRCRHTTNSDSASGQLTPALKIKCRHVARFQGHAVGPASWIVLLSFSLALLPAANQQQFTAPLPSLTCGHGLR